MRRLFIIVALITVYTVYLSISKANPEDPFPDIDIPIYPSAENIKSFSNPEQQRKQKSYTVESAYPATEIINFYDIETGKLEFVEYKDNVAKAKWISFQDGTKENKPFVRQFIKSWINETEKIKILLILRYEKEEESKEWNNNLLVTCEVLSFIDDKALVEFFNKLDKEGKLESYMELLKKYETTDQHVDFEKAIKENSDNQYLIEHYNIIKEMLGNIE